MAGTADMLNEFKGGQRILDKNPGLEEACGVLDDIKCADLGTVLMYEASLRARQTTPNDIIEGNHFNTSSSVSPRDFHYVDGIIMSGLPSTEFIELAPLQPLGTSSQIAGTDQKTIMPALRRSEVNSDATTALFREAYQKYMATQDEEDIHLATNARITRVQVFDPKTGFLPHFRMFAQVTIGQDTGPRGPKELEALASHLISEVAILDDIAGSQRGNLEELHISIGNIVLAEDIIDRGLVDRTEVRKRTQDPDFDLLKSAGFDVPETVPFDSEKLAAVMAELGITKGLAVVERFQETLERQASELIPRISFDLGRVAGIGYYRHLCYKIYGTNNEGLSLPLVDGGTTDWAKVVDPRNRFVYTTTSGIGTELLAKHFLTQK